MGSPFKPKTGDVKPFIPRHPRPRPEKELRPSRPRGGRGTVCEPCPTCEEKEERVTGAEVDMCIGLAEAVSSPASVSVGGSSRAVMAGEVCRDGRLTWRERGLEAEEGTCPSTSARLLASESGWTEPKTGLYGPELERGSEARGPGGRRLSPCCPPLPFSFSPAAGAFRDLPLEEPEAGSDLPVFFFAAFWRRVASACSSAAANSSEAGIAVHFVFSDR